MTDASCTPRLSREQRLAAWAFTRIDAVGDSVEEYWRSVSDLGAAILREGLCAAIAALMRRKDAAQAIEHLQDWLIKEQIVRPADRGESAGPSAAPASGSLLRAIERLEREQYMLAARQALAAATWLKRAAQARRKELEEASATAQKR
jgi:CRISPR-associated protein Cmr5